MDDKILEELKCPVCFEIPQSEILQCENGHIVCNQCYSTLVECPQCRIKFQRKGIRNRVLESLLDKNLFECAHKSRGCKENSARQERRSHEQTCLFGEIGTKLCSQLGFSCETRINPSNISASLSHLQTDHGFILRVDTELNVCIEKINDSPLTKKSFWTPIIFDHRLSTGLIWIFLNIFNEENKCISPLCIRIIDVNLSKVTKVGFEANFVIKPTNSDKLPQIAWSNPVVDLDQAHVFMKYPPIGLSMETLCFGYTDGSTVYVACCFINGSAACKQENDIQTISIFKESIEKSRTKPIVLPSSSSPNCIGRDRLRRIIRIVNPKDGTEMMNIEPIPYPLRPLTQDSAVNIPDSIGCVANGSIAFEGVTCGICRKTPTAARYKCLECANYDVCEKCVQSGPHMDHIFAIILNKTQGDWFTSLKKPRGWEPFFLKEASPKLPGTASMAPLNCINCPSASRYICLICGPVCGLCASCFYASSLSHANNHPFAVADTATKMRTVLDKLILNKYNSLTL